VKERNKKLLQLAQTDVILISDLPNLRYFTGFTGSSGFAIITNSKNYFLTDNRYKIQSSEEVFHFYKIIIYEKEPVANILKILKRLKLKSIGIEADTASFNFIKKLKKELRGVKFRNVSDYILSLRSVKSDAELKKIKNAIKIAQKSFNEILALIKPGIREKDIAIELEYKMMKNGADRIAFPTIVTSGSRSALPHANAGEKKIKNNEVILIDFGCSVDGYNSDITRTLVLGKPKKIIKKAFNVVKDAMSLAIENIKIGTESDKIVLMIDNYIKKAGFEDGLIHSLGHGVGLNIHELPILSKYKKMKLMKGAVFTIEPGIYIQNIGGVRIENIIHLAETGPQLLSSNLPLDIPLVL